MTPQLTLDLNGVLNSLLGLYGSGQPSPSTTATTVSSVAARTDDGHRGSLMVGYGDMRGMHQSVAESQAGKDTIVNRAVSSAGDGTMVGRNAVNNQIADLQTRLQAIATIGDTRFSGPALLDAAQNTITTVAKQVDADVAAARHQAAQIMPPAVPQVTRGRVTGGGGSRRRRRSRARTTARTAGRATSRLQAIAGHPVPSDGTTGSKAVSAASAWLGTPYIWGGGGAGGPTGGGFDCSGLTQYAVAQATDGRVVLPRTTYDQIYSGVRISPQDVRPGDLVFPASSFSARGPEHVQLAAGNGLVIEAPYSGSTVKWSRMSSDAVVVRVI
ncbi:C40 family peptidase [Nocardia vinacea]|uniref:C40 family peptidase n=1 Tax=Nocardia vinacea TaxID=96468 RepID=UPI0005945BEF|nr:C40 family peptidase [Nocardia vinacea]